MRRLAVADEGGFPAHRTSMSVSEPTTWFASSSRVARSSRGLGPPTRRLRPEARTCNGPRTPKAG
ncbi:hypothetical protein [Nonomuraea rubra]|uniref:hypothetical protein n=1 Tax=Nonomuraea rubra TaxID=46180 RepID=UPI0031E6DBFC